MIDFCSYNIRGLNNKVDFVKDFIVNNRLSLVALLETRVQENVAKIISKEISPKFRWLFNYDHHLGGRIWLGWNPEVWTVSLVSKSAQQITCLLYMQQQSARFFASFAYGFNTEVERRSLWDELSVIHSTVQGEAWTICGDFNLCLSTEEKM